VFGRVFMCFAMFGKSRVVISSTDYDGRSSRRFSLESGRTKNSHPPGMLLFKRSTFAQVLPKAKQMYNDLFFSVSLALKGRPN
jgi:hypothetical protein